MNWASAFENVNYLAVIIAALSTFVVGGFWYSKSIFMDMWIKETGLKQKDIENREGMTQIFIGTFILSLITAYFLSTIIYMVAGTAAAWTDGAVLGAAIGLAFVGSSQGTYILFQRKTLRLFALQAGQDILKLVVMGSIIAGIGF